MDYTLARLLHPENDRAAVLYHVLYRAAFKKTFMLLLFQFLF